MVRGRGEEGVLRLFGLDLAVTRFGIGSVVFDILGGFIYCFSFSTFDLCICCMWKWIYLCL